jgi:hypothetical protein
MDGCAVHIAIEPLADLHAPALQAQLLLLPAAAAELLLLLLLLHLLLLLASGHPTLPAPT